MDVIDFIYYNFENTKDQFLFGKFIRIVLMKI
jgi:hypothetical protein